MSDTATISTDVMARHLAAGDARALLPSGVPGPVLYSGHWWAVPTSESQYHPVIDPAQSAQLDQHALRYAAHRRHVHATAADMADS